MESLMVEESLNTHAMEEKKRVEQGSFNEEQSIIESISTSLEKCECNKSVVSTKESEGKIKESECLIEIRESFKEEQVEEKQDKIEKFEETKEEVSLILFEGDKREEMGESCCDIISPLNSLSSKEVNLFINSLNHFLACFSPSVQKFEAQNMENKGSLGYKPTKS
ncbi:hypothetical protein M9H77_02798 [Catharanthus roseus]|uniref:Uncharacterized protein n=1 Tax=Catharanthus roseus TaxID=4058 RepID=A0ACC0C9J9_CATRO|nr:hypothetical protein M9H77_02798 [Catharanthus roseus]